MAFDTDQQTVYQVRGKHGNEQVRGSWRRPTITVRW